MVPAEGAPSNVQGHKEFYSPEDIGQTHQWYLHHPTWETN